MSAVRLVALHEGAGLCSIAAGLEDSIGDLAAETAMRKSHFDRASKEMLGTPQTHYVVTSTNGMSQVETRIVIIQISDTKLSDT